MIATIVARRGRPRLVGARRRADPGRRARGRGGAGGSAGGGDGRALDRRAAHGAAERDRAAPGGGRDAGLGERDRVGQDRHAHQERDDGARRRHRERARRRSAAPGYAPTARCAAKAAEPIDGALRVELERALAAADRANNAVLQERDGRWTVQGDPTEGALIVAARKAGLDGRARSTRAAARRRSAVLVRAQADEHGPPRRRAAGR